MGSALAISPLADKPKKLLDCCRDVLRLKHYSLRTERSYCDWIERFIRFHGTKTHPKEMGEEEVTAFLTHLARELNVAASTQNQAPRPDSDSVKSHNLCGKPRLSVKIKGEERATD